MRSRCQLKLLLQDPARRRKACANAVPGGRRRSLHRAAAAADGERRGGVPGRGLRLRPTPSGAAPKRLLGKERATPTQAPSRVKPGVKPPILTPRRYCASHQLTRRLNSISVGPNSRICAILHGFNPKVYTEYMGNTRPDKHLCTILCQLTLRTLDFYKVKAFSVLRSVTI